MKVSEFIAKLTNTTLRNLGVTESETSRELRSEYREEILQYINSGLLELYNKFQLKVDDVFLEIRQGRTIYPITSDHFMTDWHDPDYTHYLWKGVILDSLNQETFDDDLVKILLIRDHLGIEIPLNDPNTPFTIATPQYNVLEIPSHMPAGVISIDYQCKHKKVSDDTDDIVLPDSLYDTLAYFVAAQVATNMTSKGSSDNAQKYAQLYTAAIANFDNLGTYEQRHNRSHIKFYRGGWC